MRDFSDLHPIERPLEDLPNVACNSELEGEFLTLGLTRCFAFEFNIEIVAFAIEGLDLIIEFAAVDVSILDVGVIGSDHVLQPLNINIRNFADFGFEFSFLFPDLLVQIEKVLPAGKRISILFGPGRFGRCKKGLGRIIKI